MTERFPMPWSYDDAAEMAAITEQLRPYVDSPTVRAVRITYWRDGVGLPLMRMVFASQQLVRWRGMAPADTTHISIEAPEV